MRAAPMQHSLFDSEEKQNSSSALRLACVREMEKERKDNAQARRALRVAEVNSDWPATWMIAGYSAGADGMPPYAGSVCASAGVTGAAFNMCRAAWSLAHSFGLRFVA